MWRLTHRRPEAPARFLLQWHITEHCNRRCAHCYQESFSSPEMPASSFPLVLEQLAELLDTLPHSPGEGLPRGHITLTGGEPFLHAGFPQLLESIAAQRSRFDFAVLSNGTLIDRATSRWLSSLKPRYVQVSVDGRRSSHDAIRGDGSFDQAVRGVRHLVSAGVITSLAFTAHRLNYREFPEVARLGRRLGVTRVWADRLIPAGQSARLETLSPEETREFVQLLRAARDEAGRAWFNRTTIAMHRALQCLAGGAHYRCTAGDTLLALQPDGTVLPCRRMPVPVGSVFTGTLRGIHQSSRFLQSLRDPNQVSSGCENCAHQTSCRGGLRCLSHAVTGSPFAADPGCWLAHRAPIEVSSNTNHHECFGRA